MPPVTTLHALSPFDGTIRELQSSDIPILDSILRQHVRDRSGVLEEAQIKLLEQYMTGAADREGRVRTFFVAVERESGTAVGCMAISSPDSDMTRHFSQEPGMKMELLHAFVSELWMRRNVGRRLFEACCDTARIKGARALVVNSGQRYEKSWPFYDRLCDRTSGHIENKYGPGRNAKVWIKYL